MSRQFHAIVRGRLASMCIAIALPLFLVIICDPSCLAEQPSATAVATDRSMLPTSDRFGIANLYRLTDAGNVFFTSGGNSALFRWNQATGVRQRLLQINDPIEVLGLPPEIMQEIPPGSLLDTVGASLQVNSGHAAFVVSVAIKGELAPAGAFVYNGSAYRLMMEGPGTISQVFVNSNGKMAVAGFDGALGQGPMGIYLEKASGEVVKIAENFAPAPPSVGGYYSSLTLLGFNNEGKAAFLADIAGGATTRAVFLSGGVNPPSLVVKSGDTVPSAGSCTFNLRTGASNYILNNFNKIAFMSDTASCAPQPNSPGIWIGSASAPPEKVVRSGDATGITGWGNYSGGPSLRGFNDSGKALFVSNISTAPWHALFLKDSATTAQVIFSRGQSGGSAGNFDTAQQASLNNNGKVAFLATLSGGSSPVGWYLGSGTESPVKIAAQGDSTPLGGTFGIAGRTAAAQINATNQVLFLADVLDLNAVGLFLWTNGSFTTVVSTRDSLPAGANTVLRAILPTASNTEILMRILKAGGQAAFYAKPLDPGMNGLRKIVAEYDQVPGAGTIVSAGSLSMNVKGEVLFVASLLGSAMYPRTGIIGSLPGSGLEKAILTGEPAPGGGTYSTFGIPQLNNQTQAAFWANTTAGQGIYFAKKGEPTQLMVSTITPWPGGGGNFTSFTTTVALNDNGQVAFRGTGPGSPAPNGLFVVTGGSIYKVVATGDILPAGTVTGVPASFWDLNASGQVAFVSTLSTGQGVFLGSGGGTPQPVALSGATAPDTGGKFFQFSESYIDLNDSGKVAFWAAMDLTPPEHPTSAAGWFLGSAAVSPQSRLVQGELLPGGGQAGYVAAVSRAVLANSGEMAIFVPNVSNGMEPRVVIADKDGNLLKFAASGDKADGTGSDFGKLYPSLAATPSGKFLFGSMLVGGPAKIGIFVNKP